MEIIEVKCPSCQGNIHITAGRRETYCEFCGSHLFFDDGNRVITNVNVIRDEAKLKELQIEEAKIAKAEEDKKWKKIDTIGVIGLIISFIALIICGTIGKNLSYDNPFRGSVFFCLLLILVFAAISAAGLQRRHKDDNK